jgi:hypothetical protein
MLFRCSQQPEKFLEHKVFDITTLTVFPRSKIVIHLCKYSQTGKYFQQNTKEINSGTRCVTSERKQLQNMQRGTALPNFVCAE